VPSSKTPSDYRPGADGDYNYFVGQVNAQACFRYGIISKVLRLHVSMPSKITAGDLVLWRRDGNVLGENGNTNTSAGAVCAT
jgi:hypothetical protein